MLSKEQNRLWHIHTKTTRPTPLRLLETRSVSPEKKYSYISINIIYVYAQRTLGGVYMASIVKLGCGCKSS